MRGSALARSFVALALGADLTVRQMAEFRRDWDARGTGQVTIDEFLETVQARSLAVLSGLSAVWGRFWQHLGSSGATIEGTFASMDLNRDGRLSVAEVAVGLMLAPTCAPSSPTAT